MNVAAEIERFILEELAVGTGIAAVDRTESLLVTGLVDSYGLMELAAFLGERFGIVVEVDDISPENFDSIDSIVGFVEAKKAAGYA